MMSHNEGDRGIGVSNDGQWLVWRGQHQNICFMNINESGFFQAKMPGDVQYYWVRNSHQLLVCYMTKEIVTKDHSL